jgi:hypothetical protein
MYRRLLVLLDIFVICICFDNVDLTQTTNTDKVDLTQTTNTDNVDLTQTTNTDNVDLTQTLSYMKYT